MLLVLLISILAYLVRRNEVPYIQIGQNFVGGSSTLFRALVGKQDRWIIETDSDVFFICKNDRISDVSYNQKDDIIKLYHRDIPYLPGFEKVYLLVKDKGMSREFGPIISRKKGYSFEFDVINGNSIDNVESFIERSFEYEQKDVLDDTLVVPTFDTITNFIVYFGIGMFMGVIFDFIPLQNEVDLVGFLVVSSGLGIILWLKIKYLPLRVCNLVTTDNKLILVPKSEKHPHVERDINEASISEMDSWIPFLSIVSIECDMDLGAYKKVYTTSPEELKESILIAKL